MNTTEVLSSYDFNSISKSYKWDVNRSTFPSNWWTEIIIEYLYNGVKSSTLEKEYRKTLDKASKTNNSSNGM